MLQRTQLSESLDEDPRVMAVLHHGNTHIKQSVRIFSLAGKPGRAGRGDMSRKDYRLVTPALWNILPKVNP